MTAKDFELIAGAIGRAQLDTPERMAVVTSFCAAIEEGHPRFQRSLFSHACGLTPDESDTVSHWLDAR